LLGGLPGDQVRVPQDKESHVRTTGVWAVDPVSINEGSEIEARLIAEVQTMKHNAFQETKDLQGSGVVGQYGVLKELRELSD
jgi:hypothetical protein